MHRKTVGKEELKAIMITAKDWGGTSADTLSYGTWVSLMSRIQFRIISSALAIAGLLPSL